MRVQLSTLFICLIFKQSLNFYRFSFPIYTVIPL